ncbi:type I restriction-modification system subunit M [Brevibacillus borstelensis]|uniref:class I SAM-dependent DNA methyltransferase n=1 Tax=Brevibacillus borstelensis TaxID=45462 RepID=UPI0004682132|nr:N-6 DNA methylase [Brevibacillus borstelensis]MCC0567235.1 type I restriction-modification system subunit M [Brevibacillus borstelensis]MCM3561669.1 type I restriction-modification system subunit M [Brevibacillus borstelensis]
MAQLENIEAIEKKLWGAADTLRANSNYASNEYFMPVMGLIFLRHAYSRYLTVKDEIIANLPKRGGKTRELTKEDFSQKGSIFLREKAQFDNLVALPDSEDRAKAIIEAMESIEEDYETLRGVLPKTEYQELDNDVLGQLLRTLNPEELKNATGDIFGRIYEYFLTQFADQKAHDGGEFFTPVSLVSFIANVLEPKRGTILDPACGSGGMFVQSAHFVERLQENPAERLTFYGMEKNPTTIRLAKMNLAVHGLEGNIQKAITYYEDPLELKGEVDYIMANPPFNVDEVDADKIKQDPRLPFGLPGINKNGKVPNGNYLWISYFYSYLNDTGRAGFVMSSQASSAGRDEAIVRRKLIETGAVDIMVAIRSNFFYTRSVPCELWFLNRAKLEHQRDKVLMLDARNIYRKVTRKIYDFSPEQLQNLLSIIWLYRGENERFLELVESYLERTLEEAKRCFYQVDVRGNNINLLRGYIDAINQLLQVIQPFLQTVHEQEVQLAEANELKEGILVFSNDVEDFRIKLDEERTEWERCTKCISLLKDKTECLFSLTDQSRDLVKQADMLYKLASNVIKICENKLNAKDSKIWVNRDVTKARKEADVARQELVDQLKKVRYFHKQAFWLTQRFPDGVYRDIEGLVKLVDRTELESNDWSLTPGRYVGVAPEEEDEDFDFEESLRDIHIELEGLNTEATELMAKIMQNFKELGI